MDLVVMDESLGDMTGLELADRVAIQAAGRFAYLADRREVNAGSFETFYRETVEAVL